MENKKNIYFVFISKKCYTVLNKNLHFKVFGLTFVFCHVLIYGKRNWPNICIFKALFKTLMS